ANLQVAEANVAAKRATNERAQSDLKRYTPLLATDDVSKYQFDAVDANALVAKSELAGAEQQLTAANKRSKLRGPTRTRPRRSSSARSHNCSKPGHKSSRFPLLKRPTNR